MLIGKKFNFDAAHYLPYYDGKCYFRHGHTWKVTIELEGEVQEDTKNSSCGMVIDFQLLNNIVDEIFQDLDHKDLNTFLDNPTCENLVDYIFNNLRIELLRQSLTCTLHSVQIQEGEGGYARRTAS